MTGLRPRCQPRADYGARAGGELGRNRRGHALASARRPSHGGEPRTRGDKGDHPGLDRASPSGRIPTRG